jgi:hypothetical protein
VWITPAPLAIRADSEKIKVIHEEAVSLMAEEGDRPRNVVEFPLYVGRTGRLATLDGFVMSDLAPIIGFERGAYALHNAGYRFIGDLVASSPQAISNVPGIGRKKLDKICAYIASLGLSFGEDTREWQDYRRRFDSCRPDQPDGRARKARHGETYLRLVVA